MSDSDKNMAEYRRRTSLLGGGVYGQASAHVSGWSPPAGGPTFFNAYTQINQLTPGTNYYGSSNQIAYSSYHQTKDIEIFYRFERPINRIRALFISLNYAVVNPFYEPPGAPVLGGGFQISMALTKVSHALGETYGLDNLNWNNSNRDDGTLFSDADNFEDFEDVYSVSAGASWENEAVFLSQPRFDLGGGSCLAVWFHTSSQIIQANNGPFYGMHIRSTKKASFQLGESTGTFWGVGTEVGPYRAFALTDDLDVTGF